jgi:hypothetical protein
VARVCDRERRITRRLAQVAAGLAVLGLALAAPSAALADLGPPSPAPAVAKHKCSRYTVVKGPAGPAASCTGYKTERLRAASRSGSKPAVGGYLPTSPGGGAARPQAVAPSRSRGRSRSPGATPGSPGARRPSQDRPARRRSSTGTSLGLVLGIIAASALTGIALMALTRKPLVFGPRRLRPFRQAASRGSAGTPRAR